MWIWQEDNYPNFNYKLSKIDFSISSAIEKQKTLKDLIKQLSKKDQDKIFTDTLSQEITSSAYIEGEILQRDSVRDSIGKQFKSLKIDNSNKYSDSVVSIQKDINQNYSDLTKSRLHNWHYRVMIESDYDDSNVSLAEFRKYDDMYVVSGSDLNKKIHYKAVEGDSVDDHIDSLLEYCNKSLDSAIIKAAIAHIYFVQIHPYDDGNGRIARNIVNHILAKNLKLDTSYFSISHAINKDIKSYGTILENTNRNNSSIDITDWIIWHTNIISKAIDISIAIINNTIKKTNFYDSIKDKSINNNQSAIINILLSKKTSKVSLEIAKTINSVGLLESEEDLSDLVNKQIINIVKDSNGRLYELNYDLQNRSIDIPINDFDI